MTLELIIKSQTGNSEAALELIRKFNPLLKKYAYLLTYEDAYNDLLLDFLELIKKINTTRLREISEGSMVMYIQQSVRNCFIKRSMANRTYTEKNILFCELTQNQAAEIDVRLSGYSNDELILDYFLKESLKQTEYMVICLIYYYNFSVIEIAKKRNVSRQAINQIKKNALTKLKSSLC